MKRIVLFIAIAILASCKQDKKEVLSETITHTSVSSEEKSDFTIVFASCNDQDREQPLWKPILENNPDLFIWGGDNIYADTDDMEKMRSDYNKVLANPDYSLLAESTTVIGTWDDHDYGKNDAGVEWEKKEEAQQLFLDFLKFPGNDPLREQKGIYYSKKYATDKGGVKVILLDTRFFRDSLHKSTVEGRRYDPWNENEGGSILGAVQWEWLENELQDDSTDFTIIVSSIQFLADEHGWEKWGNHPSEVSKMYQLLKSAKARNILFLSGDRHSAEFSVTTVPGLDYKLIDFTTSGLTHTFPDSPDDPNRYRIGKLVKDLNFGVLQFDFDQKKVRMKIRGLENKILGEFEQQY